MARSLSVRHLSPTSARTQARIVEAVVEAVAQHGISGTTLANVAALAEVSQGVLIFHFKSKDGLFAETLRRLIDEYQQGWQAALSEPDPLQRIVQLVRSDFAASICSRKKLALWFAFWGEAAAQPLYNAICAESETLRYEAMIAACRAFCEKNKVETCDPALLAHSIDAMTDGLWLQMHISAKSLSRTDARAMAMAHLRLLLPKWANQIAS
jgi:TetR/AcrR family transcriptional repressor of bet genes